MKEVTVTSWCDGCAQAIGESDGRVEPAVVEVVVALGIGKPLGKPRTLDLCEQHRKQLDELEALLDDYAAESGLRSHVGKAHGFPSTSAAYGTTCPICGESANRLGTHTGPAHPEAGQNVTQVFRFARESGDPLKVVAKRLRAGRNVEKPAATRKG